MLLLWFALIGTRNHAAEASISTNASVVSPADVNNTVTSTVTDFWSTLFSSDASPGRVDIRLPRLDLYGATSVQAADAMRYFTFPNNIRLARVVLVDRIKFVSESGMLSGAIAVDLMVDAVDTAGPISVTVAYN